jgi:tetratricopeptide (TPR) repeat protein
MSDKKKLRGRAAPPKSSASPSPTDFRRANEKMLQNIGKLLREREFGSPQEANAYLQNLLAAGGIPDTEPASALDRAQELMYDAWEARGSRRVKLARQAIDISPDCADAYVLLAEEAAGTPQEARSLYEQGVRAGERALGSRIFEEDVGHFWGLIETRPYMRARQGLAHTLWALGDRRQAIEHLIDMLRLNPGDNQGVRYTLANWLLSEGDDQALGKLLDQYKDDAMAGWAYSRALLHFRREGASARANKALQKAIRVNGFVPSYLLGRKKLPRHMPDYIGLGDENEAIDYAVGAMQSWTRASGALDWLATSLAKS